MDLAGDSVLALVSCCRRVRGAAIGKHLFDSGRLFVDVERRLHVPQPVLQATRHNGKDQVHDMTNPLNRNGQKLKIVGQPRELTDEEAQDITDMIIEAHGSSRQLTIPDEDLDEQATTQMNANAAHVVDASHVRDILNRFNRDYLYGLGRFDEYDGGLLLKWGDGYSRKHIWITVEGQNLVFATSHERKCGKPYCRGSAHVFTPEHWSDIRVINTELADQFHHPIYERTDD